jgi:CHAT domain-containing protein/Tfp pilus assembly protein PilF
MIMCARCVGLLCCILFIGLIGADRVGAVQNPPIGLDPAVARDLRQLITAGRFAEAEESARTLLSTTASATGEHSLATGQALDLLAEALWRGGKTRMPETRQLAQRAVALKEKLNLDDPRELSRSLDVLGAVCLELQDFSAALAAYEKGLAMRRAAYGPDHAAVASSLMSMGLVRYAMGHHAEAKKLSEESLAIWERAAPGDPNVAKALTNVALYERDYTRALQLHQRALEIREKAFGPVHVEVANSVRNLATTYVNLGALEKAATLYERALAIHQAQLGDDHPLVATSLSELGNLLRIRGQYVEAVERLEQALAIHERKSGPQHTATAQSLQLLATTLRQSGDYQQSRVYQERALRIRQAVLGSEHETVAASLDSLASLEADEARLAEARELYERALAIKQKVLGANSPRVAITHTNLGLVLRDLGDFSEARSHYERALAIHEAAFGPKHQNVADTAVNYALLLADIGDRPAAATYLRRAQSIYENTVGPESPQMGRVIHALGAVAQDSGALQQARAQFTRALAIREKALPAFHPDIAETIGRLAALEVTANRLTVARDLLTRAVEIKEHSLGQDHPGVASDLTSLAKVDRLLGDNAKAASASLRAEAILREHVRTSLHSLPEREALLFAGRRPRPLDVAVAIALGAGDAAALETAWTAIVRSRAMVLDEMAGRHKTARESVDPATRDTWKKLDAARRQLANLVVRGPGAAPARYPEEFASARRAVESLERELAKESAATSKRLESTTASIPELARALPDRSALVAYTAYEDGREAKYAAFVLRAGSNAVAGTALGNADAIDAAVRSWRIEARPTAAMPADEARYRRTARTLRRLIWDPLASHLEGIDRVFVVTDGSISLVGFAALPSHSGHYLVDDGPLLHYLSAERDLLRPDESSGRGLLAVGDPAFGNGPGLSPSKCVDLRTATFDPLPGTRRESQRVVSLWNAHVPDNGESLHLTGIDASEASVKKLAGGRRVLHIATHGFFGDALCGGQAGTRAVGGVAPKASAAAGRVPENPLRLSGLALSGANRRAGAAIESEDGILTSEEIATLDLSGVEWAVLSACDTGVGAIQAREGVLGLRRAFHVAGAQTLIMTLWSIEDRSTAAWMTALYEARLRGAGTAEAVRSATQEILRQRRTQRQSTHPFYWGAFVAVGDWR